MADGIVFILHGKADEQFAGALAGALAPMTAFPALLPEAGAPGPKFGMGAICVVVWSAALDAPHAADAVIAALPNDALNAIICKLGDVKLPAKILSTPVTVLNLGGEPGADAGKVREALLTIRRNLADRAADRGKATPRLSAAGPGPANDRGGTGGKSQMAMRSAYGLVATLAVVGVSAQIIGDPADAGATDAAPATPSADAAQTTAAAPSAGPVAAPQPAPLLSPGEAALASYFTQASAPRPQPEAQRPAPSVDPVEMAAAPAPALADDPSLAQFASTASAQETAEAAAPLSPRALAADVVEAEAALAEAFARDLARVKGEPSRAALDAQFSAGDAAAAKGARASAPSANDAGD